MNSLNNTILKFPEISDPISIILKLVGEACNLNCTYCYEKRKPYVGQRILSPHFLTDLLEIIGEHPIAIELHGGEPLLYPKKEFEKIFKILRDNAFVTTVRVQSNGTLLDPDWLRFLNQEWNGIEIGISLDGDFNANKLRYDYRNSNSYMDIVKCLKLLCEQEINVGVICVVNRSNISNAKICVEEFEKYSCIKTVKFVPCFDIGIDNNSELKGWAILPNEYANFLIEVFSYWKDRSLFQQFLIEPHFSVLKSINGLKTVNCHYSDSKCAFIYTLYPNGLVGSCDEFNKDDSIIANVSELKGKDLISTFKGHGLVSNLNDLLSKCSSCEYYSICGGGCLSTRKRLKETKYYEDYCQYRIKLINYLDDELKLLDRENTNA